jgi:hypothetical protein
VEVHRCVFSEVRISSTHKNVELSLYSAMGPVELWYIEDPHCLDNWLTDGGEFVSLNYWPRSTTKKYSFLLMVLVCVRE